MKIILILGLVILGNHLYGQHTQDLEGTWQWASADGEAHFELYLEYENSNNLRGRHCAVMAGGEKLDCLDEEDVFSIKLVRIAGEVFDGTIQSQTSGTSGRIRVQYDKQREQLNFDLRSLPPGGSYLPMRVMLYR